jgi:hypothetical protein
LSFSPFLDRTFFQLDSSEKIPYIINIRETHKQLKQKEKEKKMGTTGIRLSVSDTKEMIVRDYNFKNDNLSSEVLKTSSYGNQFWLLRKIVENGNEFVTADVVLISHKDGTTHYTEMNIGRVPYYYHCPLEWLKLISQKEDDSILNWKDSVRKYWAKKKIEIVPGMKLNFQNNSYIVIEKYTSHFWTVQRQDGKRFKMKNQFVKDSIVWESATVGE